MENSKYCGTCGSKLVVDLYCDKCQRPKIDWLTDVLNSTGAHKRPWQKEEFFLKHEFQSICVCHTCKYFVTHPLVYCVKCGNKMPIIKISREEMFEKMQDYKRG